jgi:uncharacterized protein (TIGR03382 family)
MWSSLAREFADRAWAIGVVLTCLLLPSRAVAQTTVLTFDECSAGRMATTEYACAGVASFSSSGGTPQTFSEGSIILVPSASTGGDLVIQFAAPVDRVSLDLVVYDADGDPLVRAYDADDQVVDQVVPTSIHESIELTGSGIVRLVFNPDTSWGIDDLSFDFESASFPGCGGECPLLPNCVGDPVSGDTDEDGTCDDLDECPSDPSKTAVGICGCGVSDADSDADGTANCNDECPSDPLKTEVGLCGCGASDVDSDADGALDCDDECPSDPLKTGVGACGCGESDVDSDADSVADCNDVCLGDDASGDDDLDGVCNDRDDKVFVVSTEFTGAEGPCTAGGVRLDIGGDADGSLALEDDEIEEITYVCNGETSLVRTSTLPSGSAECAQGGTRIDQGIDLDGDGTLDDDEVTSTEALCNSSGLLVRTSSVAFGSVTCPGGGTRIEMGIDADGDGRLDDDEVQSSEEVCAPAQSLFETEAIPDGDAACPHGGVRVLMGYDDAEPSGVAGDGRLQSGEVETTRDVCLAPTDVLLSGGSSSCSLRSGRQGPGPGWWMVGLLSGAALLRRRRQPSAR